MVSAPPRAQAQADTVPVGTQLRVANTDGEPLNLRAGPDPTQPVVARLDPDEIVTVIGPPQVAGTTRWLPVSTAANQIGWISDQYAVPVLAAAPPTSSPTPDLALVEAPAPSPEPLTASMQGLASAEATPTSGGPLEIEVKVKYPEAKSRYQEIMVWVARNGRPIAGAEVTLLIDEDQEEPVRALTPTSSEGSTRREFSIERDKKGTIQMVVTAVAPDGGSGRAEASYFIR
jgi:hypothetical protein